MKVLDRNFFERTALWVAFLCFALPSTAQYNYNPSPLADRTRADSLHRNLQYQPGYGMVETTIMQQPTSLEKKRPSYTDRVIMRGRHIQRVDREALKAVFIPKGQWMLGGDVSYNEWDSENLNYLVLKNIDFEGHTFSCSPFFGYFVANNIAIGGRFSYSRYFFNLGKFDLNLGEDFNISLEDLYYLEHNYYGSAFMRSYQPLGRSNIFGFFADVRLTYGYAAGKNTTGSGVEFDGTYEHVHSIQLGFCPGMTAFITDFAAVECSVGVMGLKYKWADQETNRIETGTKKSGSANFKINLFSINLGMTMYL